MKRSGQPTARQSVHDVVRADEKEFGFGAKQIGQPHRPAKMLKIRATTKTDVLAVVDLGLRRPVEKRTGTSA